MKNILLLISVRPTPRLIDRIAAAIAHLFYRIDVVGAPPGAGPLLLLPNHPNALLDPALVMATAGRPVRFLAKSTLFDGPLRPLLSAAGAIPVYRRQDGAETGRNEETFTAVADALGRGEAVCVFPEGVSHSTGRLETLRTGAARMALAAADAGVELRLVAIGINLERKTTFRSRASVAYGSPFTATHHSNRPEPAAATNAVKRLTEDIAAHMRALLVEADPDGDAELVLRVNRLYRAGRATDTDATADLERRRAIANALVRLRTEQPEFYQTALIQLRRYDDRLHRFGLTDDALDWEVSSAAALRFLRRELPLAVGLGPIAVAAAVVFAVPYGLTAAASRVTDEQDVTATAKVVAATLIYSAWIALIAVIVWRISGPVAGALTPMALLVLAVAGLFAIERESAALRTAQSWLALRGRHRHTRAALQRRRAELADVLDIVNDWIVSAAPQESAPVNHVR